VVPDLYFDVNSHGLGKQERHRLDQPATGIETLPYDFPNVAIVVEGTLTIAG